MNALEALAKLKNGEVTSEDLISDSLKSIAKNSNLNAYISVFEEEALTQARAIDLKRAQGASLGALAGLPLAIKDNIVMSQGKTTCASKIMSNFSSPYDATVIQKLQEADAVIVGKTNMDEFAMGTSTEHSAFGSTRNPLDIERIPGGSSGGSAAAVAAGTVSLALGSDTGGSIRQPAACCGVVGLKPTYGRVSRYGLVAYASSLDQIGPVAGNVSDAACLLNVIAGHDQKDQTSSDRPREDFTSLMQRGIKGKVLGIPRECFGEGLDPVIKYSLERCLSKLEKEGAILKEINLPHTHYGVAAYYIIATAEASSNLSRFDGVRYTSRSSAASNIVDLYKKSRAEGFGKEVKKRILLGTYVLSSGFYDAYYMQAQKVRQKITDDYVEAFRQCDAVVTPTIPQFPPKLGEFLKNPMEMYLSDVYTVGVNMAGLPGISLPVDKVGSLFTSIQLIGRPFGESELFQVARAVEHCAA